MIIVFDAYMLFIRKAGDSPYRAWKWTVRLVDVYNKPIIELQLEQMTRDFVYLHLESLRVQRKKII